MIVENKNMIENYADNIIISQTNFMKFVLMSKSSKGGSIYDVRKMLGFFDPPPSPFVRMLCIVVRTSYMEDP